MDEQVKQWHREQIQKYIQEREVYVTYAKTLEVIFKEATKRLAPFSIVQSRPKAVTSFAEKALRKIHKYKDPVHQLTDLCGARVITITLPLMEVICNFIKESFIVDEGNSLDVGALLGTSEFGYRSVHYVIQMKPGKVIGIPVPEEILPCDESPHKAEIQIRTVLQHAWSELSHDRIYKNEIVVPDPLKRESARLAAVLEEAESTFAHFVESVDSYVGNFDVYMDRERIDSEIEQLDTVLESEREEENQLALALRIAKMAKTVGRWEKIVEELKPFINHEHLVLYREIGNAQCQIYKESPKGKEYQQGQAWLEKATELDRRDSLAWAMRAASWQQVMHQEEKTRELYRKAYEAEPSNPYHFVSFLEYEICCLRNASILAPLAPIMRSAIAKCQEHVAVGIELPRAFFTMGKLHLLLGEADESLLSYVKAIAHCVAPDCGIPEETLDQELESLERFEPVSHSLPGREWVRRSLFAAVRRILLLAKSVKYHNDNPLGALEDCASSKAKEIFSPDCPVVFVVGGCSKQVEAEMQSFTPALLEAFESFEGILVGGGTSAGISGVIGSITETLTEQGCKAFQSIGYHPAKMPSLINLDQRYDQLIETEGEDFSPLDAVQGWVDLVASGVRPTDVKVLGIGGGPISAFEFRLALALGATVCVIKGSGRASDKILKSSCWGKCCRLIALPKDLMTLRAFVNQGKTKLSEADLDRAGRAVHAKYCSDNKHKMVDPAMRPWDQLADYLKASNKAQAAYSTQILQKIGCSIREKERTAIQWIDFTPEEIELMAEMEHGRYNFERLADGWKPGPRDPEKKISPYLVPWKDLPDNIKQYDRDAVKEFPVVLKEVGLEVYRL